MIEERPDPDKLLHDIKRDEEKRSRGKLKIFLGMAAGVGKTYTMLQEAGRLQREGRNILVGYVETHGRSETEELLEGLSILPRIKVEYQGISIEEFDIDRVISLHPEIVLVDELAHTNTPGMRHAKRYQDVLELLDAGINVLTTVNIQHIESRGDAVESITGVRIRERVPDSVFDMADEVELVDLVPEELLKRLDEGKVYLPENAKLATEKFFRKGNLIALREMSLHYTAKLVDYELREYMSRKRIKGPWKSRERLLVAVSPSPYSEYLIRWTRRIAFNMKVPWTAVYIESNRALNESAIKLLNNNLNLARELGAEVVSIMDDDIVSGLLKTAAERNVTQIVVGKPLCRYISDYFKGGNLVERLTKLSGDIDIHVVTQPDVKPGKFIHIKPVARTSRLKDYLKACASVAIVSAFSALLVPYTGYITIALIFLLQVCIVSLFIGRGPVLLSALLSALVWDFFFIPPLMTFSIGRVEDVVMFFSYFVVALILGTLTSRLKSKEIALLSREKMLLSLYEISTSLSKAQSVEDLVSLFIRNVEDTFDGKIIVFLSSEDGALSSASGSTLELSAKDRGIVNWVFENQKEAGVDTETLSMSENYFLPMSAPESVVGVVGFSFKKSLTFDQRNLLKNIVLQVSVAIERENLSTLKQKSKINAESEKLHRIILSSISHEVRTPLTIIMGATSSLMFDEVDRNEDVRRKLVLEANQACHRLDRVVENILDMSRLESGMIKLNIQKNEVVDLVNSALNSCSESLRENKVSLHIDEGLPMFDADFSLAEEVLVNLLYNASIHTPPETEIAIDVAKRGDNILFAVSDRGEGLVESEIPKLFDKFYRGSKAGKGGTGLGLSICRLIVEAHGGDIKGGNNRWGGATFSFTLPINSPKVI